MSFAVTSVDQELIKLVEQARDKGIAVVAASGNSGVEIDNPFINSNAVISVGAKNKDMSLCSYSNYGDAVDFYCLGEIELSNGKFNGTSCATPLIAGIIALFKEQNPNLTVREIRQLLKDNSEYKFVKAFIIPFDYKRDNEIKKIEEQNNIEDVVVEMKDMIKVDEIIYPVFNFKPNTADHSDIIISSQDNNIILANKIEGSLKGIKSGKTNIEIYIPKNNYKKYIPIKVAGEMDLLVEEQLKKYNIDIMHKKGIKGEGIKVAILDSGVNKVGNIDEVIYAPNFIQSNPTNSKDDNYGQGTITASIVKSIAPNCTLYSLKNQNGGGYSYLGEQKQLQALQWCIDNKMDIVIGRNLLMGIYDSKNAMFKKMNEAGIITIVKQGMGDAARFSASNTEDNLCVAFLNNNNTPFESESMDNLDVACYYAGFPAYTNNGKLEITSTQNMGASLGIVGGICALLKQQDKELNVTKLRKLLPNLCVNIGDKRKFGYGLLKAKLKEELDEL